MTLYRIYSTRDLQFDVNLLTSAFAVALADALARVLSQPAEVEKLDSFGRGIRLTYPVKRRMQQLCEVTILGRRVQAW